MYEMAIATVNTTNTDAAIGLMPIPCWLNAGKLQTFPENRAITRSYIVRQ